MKKFKACICLITAILMMTAYASAADFEFGDGDELAGIIITELPAAGTLTCGSRVLSRGSAVPAAQLEALQFECGNGRAHEFSYIPVYRDGSTGAAVSCMAVSGENEPPRAANFVVTTYKNASVAGRLPVTDSDGTVETAQVVTAPAKGRVTLTESGFVYEPYLNRKGQDSFVYTVTDDDGAVSGEATVTVNIERRRPEVEYADIDGKGYEYAALRLAEEGIYTGRSLGGRYYFEGDRPIEREEFLIMAAMAGGCAARETEEVFAGEELFSDSLTCAEAAAIADKLLGTSEFSDTHTGSEPMTLAEAARLVVEMLNYSNRATGLFSWTGEI